MWLIIHNKWFPTPKHAVFGPKYFQNCPRLYMFLVLLAALEFDRGEPRTLGSLRL